MLKRRALRKIVITTFSIITILVICILPNRINLNDNYLNPKIDTIFVTNIGSNDIYLLGPNNHLTRTTVFLNEEGISDKIKKIIEYLTIDKSSKIPNGLNAIIPSNAKLNNVKIINGIAILNFDSELLNVPSEKERKVIEALTYSLISIDGIEGIKIEINSQALEILPQTKEKLPEVLNRKFGINKIYEIGNINNTTKLTIHYLSEVDNTLYYVPVTKYLNDDRDKIEIIIDNLSSNYIYEPSLISLMKENTELMNYEIENNTMRLNFSSDILFNDNILEEVIYQITQSVFDNYDVNKILLEVDGNKIIEKTR